MCSSINWQDDESMNDHVYPEEKVGLKENTHHDTLLRISGPGPKNLLIVISIPSKYWDKNVPVKGMFNGAEVKEGFNGLLSIHETMIGKVKIVESSFNQWEISCLEINEKGEVK
jgi:hypothetical protein